jgi:hypothetical protein
MMMMMMMMMMMNLAACSASLFVGRAFKNTWWLASS